jgi:hypothetical protein
MRLGTLLPLLDLPGVTFASLQHEVREEDQALLEACNGVARIGAEFKDFADTASDMHVTQLVNLHKGIHVMLAKSALQKPALRKA